MHFKTSWLLSAALLTFPLGAPLAAENTIHNASTFSPFTGKITRNKVRLRLQPNLDGQIVRELVKEDMLVIVGEEDEFYAVEPPKGIKSYIYRTYVIDDTVEGNHVNVRLEPDTESPVIAQLNTGDKAKGVISPLNSKWLEIPPPATARFFVCKEYVENIGNADMIAKLEQRREEVNSLLSATNLISQSEMQKPFEEIRLDNVFSNLSKITQLYTDFPDHVARAKELLARIQDEYTQKKIAYLEAKTAWLGHPPYQGESTDHIRNQQAQLNQLEQALGNVPTYAVVATEKIHIPEEKPVPESKALAVDWNQAFDTGAKTDQMLSWIPLERDLYDTWSLQHEAATLNNYYTQQIDDAVVVRGLIEPYHRTVKNKPGDYILVNRTTNLPIAYLYSTQVDLQELEGQEVTMRVSPRPNNHFAFPAYFVLAIE